MSSLIERVKARWARKTGLTQALAHIPGTRQVSCLPGHNDPRDLRCQKKLKRRIMGVIRPKKTQNCPTCRVPTLHAVVRRDKVLQGKQAQTRTVRQCVCCGTEFYGRTVTAPPQWKRA
jgi:hypothetical protein